VPFSHRALTELLANIFREAGVTEEDIEESKLSFIRLATRIGTTQLEAGTIIEYLRRLNEANGAFSVRLSTPMLTYLTCSIAVSPNIYCKIGVR
jgi:hypothetical protein